MSEAVRTGALIRGTKEKSEDEVFLRTSFASNPPQDRATSRHSLLHTDAYLGTIWVQIC